MSLVPSLKKLNDGQKFIAKVEFLNITRHIKFCPPLCHVTNPHHFLSYSNLPGLSSHTHICLKYPVLKFLPKHIRYFVMTSNSNTISPPKVLAPNSLVHSLLLPPAAVLPLHIRHPPMKTFLSSLSFSELFELL
jgi:hypothetical protein